MPNDFDANVKLNDPFDVILDVEIGRDLNQGVNRHDARVAIRNLTQSTIVATVNETQPLVPSNNSDFQDRWRINIAAGWGPRAQAGDVLQAIASYKVTAGANVDFSTAESRTFVVS